MEPINIVLVVTVVAVGAVGYLLGRSRASGTPGAQFGGPRLEEFPFYPFVVNVNGHVEFNPDVFDEAVSNLIENHHPNAARELIVIGEQNLVRDTFPTDRLQRYKNLYAKYEGDAVVSDNERFLENYKRIVGHIGRSFPNTGIEILLHNLVNPARSLVAIENSQVTGRSIGGGATNLVLDLKTRRLRGEDKINYELNIGSRQFKCTTIPIFRAEYGLVGAICINVDSNFIRGCAAEGGERLSAMIDNLLRTDFQLDENILSVDEYQNALAGKRHFLDETIRRGGSGFGAHKLAAILFSDIVGYTEMMGNNEAAALDIVATDEAIHTTAINQNRGRILKRLGDGLLASFDSASDAVAAAQAIQRAVKEDGRFSIRIGVDLGEVVDSGGDIHGHGVNIAARIQDVIQPGEIGVSAAVFHNIRNKAGVTATDLGEQQLKNVLDPVRVYVVASPSS
jgi:class 3 adenylate cyclase